MLSSQEIRECLKLDPEHKECFPLYKKIKKVDKLLLQCEDRSESRDYLGCVDSASAVLELEREVSLVVFEARKWLCSCYSKVRDIIDLFYRKQIAPIINYY